MTHCLMTHFLKMLGRLILAALYAAVLIRSEPATEWSKQLEDSVSSNAFLRHLCNKNACQKCKNVFEKSYMPYNRVYFVCFQVLANESCCHAEQKADSVFNL